MDAERQARKQGDVIVFESLFQMKSEKHNDKIPLDFFKAAAPSSSPDPSLKEINQPVYKD